MCKYKLLFILVRFYGILNFLDRYFEKSSNIKFHENPCNGIRARSMAMGGQTDRTEITKLILAFRSFPKAPKNQTLLYTVS